MASSPYRVSPPDEAQAALPPTPPIIATAPCGPCGGWWDWGHRLTVCASPSEGELDALLACINSTCKASCTNWISGYKACESSGDPSCSWPDDPSCDTCITTPDANGGCRTETTTCGADTTGCVLCGNWLLASADEEWLCPYASIDAAVAIQSCSCSEASCAKSCDAWGLFYPDTADAQCSFDVQTSCSAQYNACIDDANASFRAAPPKRIGQRRMTDALRDFGGGAL